MKTKTPEQLIDRELTAYDRLIEDREEKKYEAMMQLKYQIEKAKRAIACLESQINNNERIGDMDVQGLHGYLLDLIRKSQKVATLND